MFDHLVFQFCEVALVMGITDDFGMDALKISQFASAIRFDSAARPVGKAFGAVFRADELPFRQSAG